MSRAKPPSDGSRAPSLSKDASSSEAYDKRAAQLLKAIAISDDIIARSTAFSSAQKEQIRAGLREMRAQVENPEPQFRNPRSLAFIEEAVVQPWNEEKGPDADAFWERAAEAGLDYKRGKTLREPRPRSR